MGVSDNEIFREFVPAIRPYLENLKDGDRIAWLGQQTCKMAQKSSMFGQLSCHIKAKVEHHCFDIENDNFEGYSIHSNWWDANDSWENKIQGFDLVLGIRILYACDSAKQTLKNLKYVVDKIPYPSTAEFAVEGKFNLLSIFLFVMRSNAIRSGTSSLFFLNLIDFNITALAFSNFVGFISIVFSN